MAESQILFFILTSLLIILIPGQDMVLVLSKGMTQGIRAGMITAAGISTGLLGHSALAALGLGAILLSSESVFTALKLIGAAYLCFLGLRLFFSKAEQLEIERTNPRPLINLFGEGVICNISNPKITIFYFAYLPQFVSPDTANPAMALLTLGISFALLTLVVKASIGFFAGSAADWLQSRPGVIKMVNRASGTLLIGLGIRLATDQR